MARKIVSTGRGGAGKSTFVALIVRYLKPPTLLVDLDPDLSLDDMLGADFRKEKKGRFRKHFMMSLKQEKEGQRFQRPHMS